MSSVVRSTGGGVADTGGVPAGRDVATRARNRSMPAASAPCALGSASSMAIACARSFGSISCIPDPPKPAVMKRPGIIPSSWPVIPPPIE